MTFNSSGSNQDSQAIANFNDTGVNRNFSLDVLRGIALLGILLISIWEFGGFSINEQTRLRLLQKGTDYNLYYYISVFFEGKMRALFSLVFGAGILVSRMLGLRNPEQFNVAAKPAIAPAWVGGVFADAGGTRWLELDLPALAREQRFLEVGA